MSDPAAQEYIRTFNRFELKYLLHVRQARELLDSLGAHVTTDANAGRDGFYKIASVYYDSADLSAYWEKLDGEKYRRKVRVRTYGEQPGEGFLEVKQRLNLTVQKRRCRMDLGRLEEAMRRAVKGRYTPGLDPVFDEVFVMIRRDALRPRLLVSYNRTAFFDRYKKDLRITLDRNIRCRSLDLDLTRKRTRGRYSVPPEMMILEVKFNEAVPRWLCTCLNRLDLQVIRISKYCEGIQAMGLQLPLSERAEQQSLQRWMF